MRVTLADIAKKARVSAAAVSKALNNRSDISAATRKRIKRIAAQMGYVTNVAARTLSMNRTQTLGVVMPFPHIPTVTDRLRGIQAAALEHTYLTSVALHDGRAEDEMKQIQMLLGRVDGLIITPANQTEEIAHYLKAAHVPAVALSEPLIKLQTDFIGDDDREGGTLAARHLLKANRFPFAYLGEAPGTPSDMAILQGVEDVLSENGKHLAERMIRWGNVEKQGTWENIDALLALPQRPQAVFAFSDLTAMWALQRLEAKGLHVPNDVGLIGYDNTLFAELARVPLTSIAQPNFDIGHQAAITLLERLKQNKRDGPFKRIIFKPKLIVRSSSRAL